MRDLISRELIVKKDFRFVAIEGDWPDAARIDHYVRHLEYPPSEWTAFARFPTWMWRNEEVRAFVDWLRTHNAPLMPAGARAEQLASFTHFLDIPILLVIVSLGALRPAGWTQFVLGVVIAATAASLLNYVIPRLYPWGGEDTWSPHPAGE
jgi:hypothetical protein